MTRTLRRRAIAVLAIVGVLTIAAFLVVRFAVPPRWPGDAIHVPRDAVTLEQALHQVSVGGTIVLHAQVEEIEGPIMLDVADVTIDGAGEALVRGEGADPAITLRADGITLIGLAISGESIGLRIEGSRCRVEEIDVRDAPIGIQLAAARGCELVGVEIEGAQTGLELVSARGNEFKDVVIEGASEVGVRILESRNNAFDSIVVTNAPTGISMEQASTENDFVDCRILSSSVAGIHVRNSNENRVIGGSVEDSQVGVLLEAATGCEIRDVRLAGCEEAGIRIRQAAQNRVIGNIIRDIDGSGIDLMQSAENALSYNAVSDCRSWGIQLERSDRSLVMANEIGDCENGIRVQVSEDCRLLRNTVMETVLVGIYVTGGGGHRLLDNRLSRGGVGIAIDSTEGNTLLRNRIERQVGMELNPLGMNGAIQQAGIALALLSGSSANHVASNELVDSQIGLLLVDSSRADAMNNAIAGCDQGVVLFRLGPGVRIEGNRIENNNVGLALAEASIGASGAVIPVIANNVFVGNESVDIRNLTDVTLYASGNWWGEINDARGSASARVTGDVSFEESAWRGTVAVGTEVGTAHEILGRLVQNLLIASGFRVIDLIGMGDGSRVGQAVSARDVDLIWWGASGSDSVPGDESATRIIEIPAARGWSAVIGAQLADRLSEPTLSALAALAEETGESFRLTAPRSVGQEALQTVLDAYSLRGAIGATDWTETQEEAEALLKFGVAGIAIVDNLDETLTVGGFVALEDDLQAFSSTPIVVVLRDELVEGHPEIGEALWDLGSRLTTRALHDLISRVRSLHQLPNDVAREFLVQTGLLTD